MLLEICCPDKIYRSIDLKSELNSFDADGETVFSVSKMLSENTRDSCGRDSALYISIFD